MEKLDRKNLQPRMAQHVLNALPRCAERKATNWFGVNKMSTEREQELEFEEGPGLYNSDGGAGKVFRRSLVQSLTVLVVVVLALLAQATVYILLLVFAGILLAVLLDYFGTQIERMRGVPRWLAITAVLALLTALFALVFVLVVPMVAEEGAALATQLEQSAKGLHEWLQENAGGRFLMEQLPATEDQMPTVGELWTGAAGIFATTVGAMTGVAIIVVVGVFIAYNPSMYTTGFLHMVPLAHRERAAEVMAAIGATVRRWLLGQLISMGILAVSTWVMLALLGVSQALILALITGLMTFVPYLGPLIALVPILLVAYLDSPLLALYVLLLYMAIQNVEANVIMPIVFHRTAHIPPALGVVSQILFGSLLGFLGFVLAIPLMAVVLQLVKMIYVEDILGDRSLNKSSS